MLSTYGTNIMPFLFGPITDLTEQDLTQQISDSLAVNAPEVTPQGVDIQTTPGSGTVNLTVNYTLSTSTNGTESVSIPLAIS